MTDSMTRARRRFVMVGGFLGAGKTTTIGRLATMYRDRGQRVAIVTNDQAADLADTQNLASRGFAVAEVPGACFCCKFDSLVEVMQELGERERPDVIIAEPVGSCTDLVATVVQSLRRLMPELDVAPFPVVLKPSLARFALQAESPDLSSNIGYIFRKQLEEADLIVINRADDLGRAQLAALTALVAERYPTTPVLVASAKTGLGFDALHEFLGQDGDFGRRILEIDYDVYADAEAELGWLNTTARMVTPAPFLVDDVLLELIGAIDRRLVDLGALASHVKTLGLAGGTCGVANLISSGSGGELSRSASHETREIDLVINARVAADPSALERAVRDALTFIADGRSGQLEYGKTRSFRPGRPMPTHRFAAPL